MKIAPLSLTTLAIILTGCAATPSPAPNDLRLVWADEFDTPGLPDPAIWEYDTHANQKGWYNNEAQYYAAARPDNARVEGGELIITARKETLSDMPDYGGQEYSSARLRTKGRKTVQYGRVEARLSVPCGRGLWPAFWMLPEAGRPWPNGGEIDIMEYVGHDPDRFHAAIHTEKYNHMIGTEKGGKKRVDKACESWHTHRLDWTPEQIQISVDDAVYFTYDRKGGGQDAWPFDAPFHILLNIAIGGDWGGQKGIDPERFPAEMRVDYVRVFERVMP